VSVAGAVLGIVFALGLYKNLARAEKLKQTFAPIHKLLENKWYVDELYEMVFIKPIRMLCNFLWKKFDVAVIDRVVLSFGHLSSWTGQTVRMVQTGSLQVYAVVLVIGLLASVGYLIYGLA
jgi:NADH-quinone oxidoreductase subunit L